ncbi:hypothetical protein [Streptomyces sp. HNM0574]|uniref:hypothetical protein n=1 Tax=Streptomyces sp. HNM0574 TaxID=2714954 RepID=UPI00146D6C07|nr:hypothetical protein [Streptomyces sp. HNM0574]NLU70003.1 hypothetical protein [Streptomyces sp. HNM0574]
MHHVRTSTRTTFDEVSALGGTVREAYSFACMKCGHAWEQEYEIEHLEYPDGSPLYVYYADGERVRSPLKHPRCMFCDGRVLRIMRAGRASAAIAAERTG